ncbi:MAG: proline dehydrogenase family protein [Cyclobacteriaceae bacterium]|nr:proline dehydrogenase family protein [Cyclobacteriaceae bacterium]MCH8516706.1 proline dehydrogenase family protein [Cyclobacteriaceae bacterium]
MNQQQDTEKEIILDFDNTERAFIYKTDWELRKANLLFSVVKYPWLTSLGTSLLELSLKLRLPIKWIIKKTLFEQFCGGENIKDCTQTIEKIYQYKVGTILDYSVEGEKNEKGFERVKKEVMQNILHATKRTEIPFCVFKMTGLGRFKLLEKKQSGVQLSQKELAEFEAFKNRVDEICKSAYENKIRVFIDGEESWIQDTIDDIAIDMMRKYNQESAIIYNTYQLYRNDILERLKFHYELSEKHPFHLGAKLVRGAYMEKERERAKEMGYKDPIHKTKEDTNRDFDLAQEFCMNHIDRMGLCSGTHNEESNYKLAKLIQDKGLHPKDPRVFFAQLYGMSDHISFNLTVPRFNVAKYVPYGPVKSVAPYLVRRAKENTSVKGQSSRELLNIKKELERRKSTRI